jgi:hypothetical protein
MAKHGLTAETILKPENVTAALAVMDDMVDEHWEYLETALRYLMLLPMSQLRLRIFCAIPLFMAVATVRRCEGNPAVFQGPRPGQDPPPPGAGHRGQVAVAGLLQQLISSRGTAAGRRASWTARLRGTRSRRCCPDRVPSFKDPVKKLVARVP